MPNNTNTIARRGLLGLAMGHGCAPDLPNGKVPKLADKTTKEDPAIQKGLKASVREVPARVTDTFGVSALQDFQRGLELHDHRIRVGCDFGEI